MKNNKEIVYKDHFIHILNLVEKEIIKENKELYTVKDIKKILDRVDANEKERIIKRFDKE